MKCQIAGCPQSAEHQIAWRSNFMDVSAYWYHCRTCTIETLWQFQQSHGRVQYVSTPLPADIIGA